jgi:hypothetical protein
MVSQPVHTISSNILKNEETAELKVILQIVHTIWSAGDWPGLFSSNDFRFLTHILFSLVFF